MEIFKFEIKCIECGSARVEIMCESDCDYEELTEDGTKYLYCHNCQQTEYL